MNGRPVKALALATALAGCVALVGCSGGRTAAAAPASSAVKTSSVDLPPSYVFKPEVIEVAPGTTVTWTNHDNFTHSVQVQGSGADTSVHVMSPGQTAQITFTTPGTYAYVCTFHTQNMRGTVVVDAK